MRIQRSSTVMKPLLLGYALRSVWSRRGTTGLTLFSMGMVVWVFAAVLMMSEGIRATFVSTGSPGNVIVLRRGSAAEINSTLSRDQVAVLSGTDGIARDADGKPRFAAEVVVLNSLPKRNASLQGNVAVRGSSDIGFSMRSALHLSQGRMFRPGTNELIVGAGVQRGFAGMNVGATLRLAGREWTLVGVFEDEGSGFESEIWGDSEQVVQAFRRGAYSTAVFTLSDQANFEAVQRTLEADPRLQVEVKPEQEFYAEQSEQFAHLINLLGLSLSLSFAIGAVAGAMITMFATVASRAREIGTLRALGFRRNQVLAAFLVESLALAVIGGALGVAGGMLTGRLNITTTNMQSFSEVSFRFEMTAFIATASMIFSLTMGVLGGAVPAWRAARLQIVDALRTG